MVSYVAEKLIFVGQSLANKVSINSTFKPTKLSFFMVYTIVLVLLNAWWETCMEFNNTFSELKFTNFVSLPKQNTVGYILAGQYMYILQYLNFVELIIWNYQHKLLRLA